MKIVDANIVLRYLLNDHEELSEKAAAIIDQNEVMIPNEVVAEIVYVLQKVYGVKDNEICDTLLELFNGENIVVDNMEMMEEAMGAVPEGYEQIVLLDGVKYDTVWYGENAGYRFKTSPGFAIKELT